MKLAALEAALGRIADEHFPAALASSLSAEDMLLTDVIARLRLPLEVFVLDTGRLHAETLSPNRIPASQMPLRIGPLVLPGYGFGLAGRVMTDTGQALGLTSLDECGWAGAASTYFWIDPGEDLIGITMAQYLGAKVPLGDDIRNAVYQALDDG